MRILTHRSPLLSEWPAPRSGGWNPALDEALVRAEGSDALLDQLHRPGALAVTTGQQPGLFTGPLYTIHKAFSARALAARLADAWQRPVVPIFWLAGDDHDFAEASASSWIGAEGALVRWGLPARAGDRPQHSMAREYLPAVIAEGLERLTADLPEGAAKDATIAWLAKSYRPGVSLHAAFRDALAELLAPFGILCLDPTHPAFKRAQSDLLWQALQRAGELDAALAALPDAGTGIAAGDGATLVFLETESGRDRLVIDGDGFRTRRTGLRYTRSELQQHLREMPEDFSANVLLRPVVESALLPTVAYLGGPAEMRYLTRQAAVLYPLLDVVRQTPVARWSGTLIEPWAERVLSRLGLSAEQVLEDDGVLEREILRRDLPAGVTAAIEGLRHQVRDTAGLLRREGAAIDPGLVRSIDGRSEHMAALVDDLERRFENHIRRRGDIAYRQFRRLRDALRPGGAPQERVLTAASMLGRYGTPWLEAVASATDAWAASLLEPESSRG